MHLKISDFNMINEITVMIGPLADHDRSAKSTTPGDLFSTPSSPAWAPSHKNFQYFDNVALRLKPTGQCD